MPTLSVTGRSGQWRVTGAGYRVGPFKTKAQAKSALEALQTYSRYAGKDHTGRAINGFTVGGRYGYYAVDEIDRTKDRRQRVGSGNYTTVLTNLTQAGAKSLARALNKTIPKGPRFGTFHKAP